MLPWWQGYDGVSFYEKLGWKLSKGDVGSDGFWALHEDSAQSVVGAEGNEGGSFQLRLGQLQNEGKGSENELSSLVVSGQE